MTKIRLYKEERVVLAQIDREIKKFKKEDKVEKFITFPHGLIFHSLFSQFQYMKKSSPNFTLVAYEREKQLLLALSHAINHLPSISYMYTPYIIQLEKSVFEHEIALKENQSKVKI